LLHLDSEQNRKQLHAMTMTLLLLIGGLALFALCFRAIDWFEKI